MPDARRPRRRRREVPEERRQPSRASTRLHWRRWSTSAGGWSATSARAQDVEWAIARGGDLPVEPVRPPVAAGHDRAGPARALGTCLGDVAPDANIRRRQGRRVEVLLGQLCQQLGRRARDPRLTPSSRRSSAAASISSTRRAACARLPSSRRSRSGRPITAAISSFSQSPWPAASAAATLSTAAAARPFMNTERTSFIAAASPAWSETTWTGIPSGPSTSANARAAGPEASAGVPIPFAGTGPSRATSAKRSPTSPASSRLRAARPCSGRRRRPRARGPEEHRGPPRAPPPPRSR